MTNEELVEKIKAGEVGLKEELWLQVERYVKKLAYSFATVKRSDACLSAGITYEDLCVSGYLALEQAIDYFDPDKGTMFSTVLTLFLKKVFYEEAGLRTSRTDALSKSQSLDAEIYESEDGGGITLEQSLSDPNAEQAFADVEEACYTDSLRADLEEALGTLSPAQAQIIRDSYFSKLTVETQALKCSLSSARVKQIRDRALELLRRHEKLQAYRENLFSSTKRTGFRAWKDTGLSQQEAAVIKLENYERMLGLSDTGKNT